MDASNKGDIYTFDSAYQQIRVFDGHINKTPARIFSTNEAMSSAIYLEGDQKNTSPFQYVREAVRHTVRLLDTKKAGDILQGSQNESLDILVIGAA